MTTPPLADAKVVTFGEIDAAIGQSRLASGRVGPGRALVATIVVVGPGDRVQEAADPIEHLGRTGAIRGILIPHGDEDTGEFVARVEHNVVLLQSMRRRFVDNAVAALRLSSLPTLIWWRGGNAETLHGLVKLCDRMVLDADPTDEAWRASVPQIERAAFSDLRWAHLTRWRALMAQFFDMEEVCGAAPRLTSLTVAGGDAATARLFAAWVRTTLPDGDRITATVETHEGARPIERISLSGEGITLTLDLTPRSTCVAASATVNGGAPSSRVVSLGQQTLLSLLSEELAIRSRDDAFERALRAIVEES